jgi:4-diphosphocytidyl-2-C-methyl-D-erythritol kinase
MQTISLSDRLEFAESSEPGVRLTCEGPQSSGVPTDSTNLVARAARSILDLGDCSGGLDLRLVKQIPSQAGLGGGSSDAAATLLGVTALLGLDIGPKLMRELAASLGSDVPFFLSGGTAVVRGRGENIAPIADAPGFWLVIVKPRESVSTAWAYGALDADEGRISCRATRQMEDAIRAGDPHRVAAGQCNDFEPVVFRQWPNVAWLRDELQMAGALGAHLCGSGSAVYGVAKDETQAEQIAGRMRGIYADVFVARTLPRVEANPLRECVA